MTTKVTIEACCAEDTQVSIVVSRDNELDDATILQNGARKEIFVHDDIRVSVYEMPKK